MKKENQVVSLKLAEKLKELGFEQDSCFWWRCSNNDEELRDASACLRDQKQENQRWWEFYSAYTAGELGEMIPGRIQIDRFSNGQWGVTWMSEPLNEYSKSHSERADSEVNVLAKMAIYLKESESL